MERPLRWLRRARTIIYNADRRKKLLFVVIACLLLNSLFFFTDVFYRPRPKYNPNSSACSPKLKNTTYEEEALTYSTRSVLAQRKNLREILGLDCTRCFKTILIDGEVGFPSSFGRVSTTFALVFDQLGWDVYIEAWKKRSVKEYGGRLLELWRKWRPGYYDLKLRVSHPDSFDTAPEAGYNLALSAWEATHLPTFFSERVDRLDVLFTPSIYNRNLFRSELDTSTAIELFHHGIDTSVFYYVERSPAIGRPYIFLFVATNTHRKNPEAVLEAFKLAFPSSEYGTNDVKLIMASTPPYTWDALSSLNKDERIVFEYASRTDAEIRDLYSNADCFVLPTRGEGFGLPILEAMATGLPVITTDFGGAWDFCHPDLCYLARINGVSEALSPLEVEERDRGLLVEVDKIHLSELIWHVYNNPNEALARGKEAAEEVKQNWSWETVITTLFPPDLLCAE